MTTSLLSPPLPQAKAGSRALQALIRHRHILAALSALHAELGDVFRLSLPGFKPVVMAGPEANRFVLTPGRDDLRWRNEGDPVVTLLRQGLLVVDGEQHDQLRQVMDPALHRTMLVDYVAAMVACTDRVTATWPEGQPRDMLVEMRRIALLILMKTMFQVDLYPDLERLWQPILKTLAYISPGPWLIWPGMPRPGYRRAIRRMDDYLLRLIRTRRQTAIEANDLLGRLIAMPGMSDDLIRDQMLTMLIAGHDTGTALLAWTLYLLGAHPPVLERLRAELDSELGAQAITFKSIGQLKYLDWVIKESLRLYPPIHAGMRRAAVDLTFQGFHIPAGTRILYSIYLTHRHPAYWPEPDRFDPERFSPEQNRARVAHTYVPFGGGPRNCIGAAFGLVEAKVVLTRLLQQFDVQLVHHKVQPHMGATLEPHPGVYMRVRRRREG